MPIFLIIITIILRILSLTSHFLSLKSSHSMEQNHLHILSILKLLYIFFFLVLSWKSEHLNDISLYTEALLLKLWHIFTYFLFFSAMMYNKCDVFVRGHKWKCKSTKMDSLFSSHEYYRALHPYVPFHFLYFISVCWCSTVSWMQDRYCTKLYCYWLKNVIKSCLRSLFVELNPKASLDVVLGRCSCFSTYWCHADLTFICDW